MVEISDIDDKDRLRAWLSDQPRGVSVWIASRSAARMLPVGWDGVLTEDWARESDVTTLPVLRSVLISSVAAFVTTDDIRAAAGAARAATAVQATIAAHSGLQAAEAAVAVAGAARAATAAHAATVAHAVDAAADAAADSVIGAARAAKNAEADADADEAAAAAYAANRADRAAACAANHFPAIRTDAECASGGTIPDAAPLWPDGPGPLAREWARIKRKVAEAPDAADWQFWLDWYDAQLAGRTMLPDPARTWEMLEQIALIDAETWDAGPEVVNPKIREIWELHRLRAEVAALQAEKEAFLASRASQAQRSHNQPPDGLVDDQPEAARQITMVWDSLDEARDALEQKTPDKGKLREIADRLLSALTAIVRYCGKVADATVMAAAKIGGGAIGTALLDHVANNGRLMQFAKDLLTYGGG